MKKFSALASFEFESIAIGMQTTDFMLKKAPVALVRCGSISRGRYLCILCGTTGAIAEAVDEAVYRAKSELLDHTFIADVHPQLVSAVLGDVRTGADGALAIMETSSVSCNIQATERVLKGTDVQLVEIRLGDTQMGGRGMSIYRGQLHEIEAAIETALTYLEHVGQRATYRILPAPHEAMIEQIETSTRFKNSANLELEGETLAL